MLSYYGVCAVLFVVHGGVFVVLVLVVMVVGWCCEGREMGGPKVVESALPSQVGFGGVEGGVGDTGCCCYGGGGVW